MPPPAAVVPKTVVSTAGSNIASLPAGTDGSPVPTRFKSAAQTAELDPDLMVRLTATRWSMIQPDKDYEGGCVVGFLAFSFSQTGYFIYNNRIRGSWRIDELGNIKIRTKDGQRFTMILEDNQMRPAGDFGWVKRNMRFQRCPA